MLFEEPLPAEQEVLAGHQIVRVLSFVLALMYQLAEAILELFNMLELLLLTLNLQMVGLAAVGQRSVTS